jgi:hypothetical protein
MEVLGAVIAIEVSVAAVTVSTTVFDVIVPCLAVMFDVPTPTPVARPVFSPMLATPVFDEFQATCVVMFEVEPSLNVPVAVN